MYKIQTVTAGSAVASLDFTVPSGYDDLYVVASVRDTTNSNALDHWIRFNNNTSNYTWRKLQGSGSAVNSASASVDPYLVFGVGPGASTTANTFGNFAAYISNYSASASKSVSVDAVGENNGTQAFQVISAGIWADTTAITSIQILPYSGGQFVEGSTATLYGIRKYNTTSTPKATGGIITYANGYWVHTFTASGTFTPTQNITCEYLVIAGGGGGGAGANTDPGGAGGAGGYRSSVAGESSGRGSSAESPLSLTASTNYTVTVGAGGNGAVFNSGLNNRGTQGSNSVFSTITSTGGGYGGGQDDNGGNGGAGGGAGPFGGVTKMLGGTGTTAQGYDGGNGSGFNGGAGGGAGSAASTTTAGAGLASAITGQSVTRAVGGSLYNGTAGTVNTGNGGNGANGYSNAGRGGSGIVIVRYAA